MQSTQGYTDVYQRITMIMEKLKNVMTLGQILECRFSMNSKQIMNLYSLQESEVMISTGSVTSPHAVCLPPMAP